MHKYCLMLVGPYVFKRFAGFFLLKTNNNSGLHIIMGKAFSFYLHTKLVYERETLIF